jgi:hypothetical protein
LGDALVRDIFIFVFFKKIDFLRDSFRRISYIAKLGNLIRVHGKFFSLWR